MAKKKEVAEKKVRVALSLRSDDVESFKADARDMGLTFSQYVSILLTAGSSHVTPVEAERANNALAYFREKAWS